MIDICGIFNFQSQPLNCVNSFLEAYHNYVPDYNLREIKFDCGNIFYTERKESPFPYFHKTTHIFIFGTVFMRQDYNNAKLGNQKVLLPQDLLDFYDRFSVEMAKYIKGNFAIIIYDDHRKELVFISSKLNTLPLFYYYKNNNFIFSSSIKAMLNFIDIQPKLNEKSLVEQAIFYYPLSDKTYLNDILQLPPATVLKIDKNELKAKKYWQIEDLFYKEQLIKEDDALYKCMDLMKENLKVYTSCDKKFLLSLTAGFDSRTNLALIDRDPKDFLCYSYGMPLSKQIEIPLFIAKKLGLNYRPVYLDKKFEENYETYALKALNFSDGTAPVIRANFPYAFEQLSSFSKENISGLFGSEIIKCFYRANEQVSQETMDLFINGDCEKSFQKAIRNIKQTGYISHDIIDKYSREIKEDFVNNYIQRLKGLSNIHRFYIFLFEEAIRKYFMQEVRIERYYVNTLTPYFDEEFLELILRTPFAGIYKSEGRKNLFSRRDSQIFYAKIIQTAKPALGDIITDRGYKPNELLLPFIIKAFKIGSAYLQEKTIRSLKGNDVFRSELWSKNMVEKYIYKIGNNDDIFTDRLTQGFNIGLNLKGDFRFFSFFSLRLWLYLLRNNL